MKRANKGGFTIIETMIAIALAAIIGTSLIGMVLQAQSIATSAKLKNQAASYAEQLVEKTRQYRKEHTWSDLSTKAQGTNWPALECWGDVFTGTPQLGYKDCTLSSSPLPIGSTLFSQLVGISQINPNVIGVTGYIFYYDRGNNIIEKITTYISNK